MNRWGKPKKKAEAYVSLSKALDIPLKQNPVAPSSTPVLLKRVMRKPVVQPADRPQAPEYCISDTDYKILSVSYTMRVPQWRQRPALLSNRER